MTSQPIRGRTATAATAASAGSSGWPTHCSAAAVSPPASSGADAAGDAARQRAERLGALERVRRDRAALVGDLRQRLRELGGELVERPALVGLAGAGRVSIAAHSSSGRSLRGAPQRRQHGSDAARGRGGRAGADRVDPRQRLVEHEREAVEVAALVDALAGGLLGSHVGERADDVAGAGERLVAGQVGDAEVGQLGHARRPSAARRG